MTRGRLEAAWDELREQKLAQLDQALENDLEVFRIHTLEKIDGLHKVNAGQRRPWESPEPPEGFTLPRQSFVERPVDTGVSVREVITRLSATAWTTEVEIEDDNMADYSELPNDGR